jgi:3-dehydroquinate dehydratase/shikimate dehydrogenase
VFEREARIASHCLWLDEMKATRICVPVCARLARDLVPAIFRAAERADLIEVRLDCLEAFELEPAMVELKSLLVQPPRPLILTFRPAAEGGFRKLDLPTRHAFWTSLGDLPENTFVDWELDLALSFGEGEASARLPQSWERVICSFHDFSNASSNNLDQLYERLAATPARILKLAVEAHDITDCLEIFRLLGRARREGRELIAIAMGQTGLATRILGPAHGSFLTYGFSDAEHSTAPGQTSALELRELYRIDRLDEQTLITGLAGNPVAHSVSPQMHNRAFAAQQLNAVYIPFEVHDVGEFMRRMVHPRTREMAWNLRGLSITAPHKEAVMRYLDWLEPAAREIGAVNTVVAEGEILRGYNTDAAAFFEPLSEKIGPVRDLRVAVIGAGGAARSILWSLREASAQVTLFARHVERAGPLAEEFNAFCAQLEDARFSEFEVVINATPLGTRGQKQSETPALAGQLRGARLAYDLVYNPGETRFLREAREAGCETLGGLSMLVAQAAAQFRLWTNEAAPRVLMLEAARAAIA